MQRPPWLAVVLLAVALVSTAGWAITARRAAPAAQAAAPATTVHDHRTHSHGGTAHLTPPVAPQDGVVAFTVPKLPKTAVNFIWRPEHVLLAAGQEVELTFTPDGDRTRLELVHTGWERLGDRMEATMASYVTGWDRVLNNYVEAANS